MPLSHFPLPFASSILIPLKTLTSNLPSSSPCSRCPRRFLLPCRPPSSSSSTYQTPLINSNHEPQWTNETAPSPSCAADHRAAGASASANDPASPSKQPTSGLFVGSNKGYVVTRKELAPRPSSRKGVREHARKLLEKHVKKPFFDARYGESVDRMTVEELEKGKRWLNETFYLIRVTPGNLQASLISAETKEDGLISVIYLGKSSANGPNGQSFGPQNSVEPVSGTDQLENIQRKAGG